MADDLTMILNKLVQKLCLDNENDRGEMNSSPIPALGNEL